MEEQIGISLFNELVGALVGLARATFNNPNVTDDTYACLVESLALTNDNGISPEHIQPQIDAVRAEKHRISPDCAVCTSPCGRTADYDLSAMSTNGKEVFALKSAILDEIRSMAVTLKAARRCGKADCESEYFLCEALFRVGYDESTDTLAEFCSRVREMSHKCGNI